MDQGVGGQVVKATAPLAEMLRYASDLTSITSGRGMFTMEFDHYDEVPGTFERKNNRSSKNRKRREIVFSEQLWKTKNPLMLSIYLCFPGN